MRRASKAIAPWGIASALLVSGVTLVATAGPALAQTPPPSPAPGLGDLLPALLKPLQPILAPPPAASNPGSTGSTTSGAAGANAGSAGSSTGGLGAASLGAPIPTNIEYHCGPTPAPLVFNRTAPRSGQDLENAAAAVTPPGGNVANTLVRIAAPFPVAGSFHYRDDWGEPRSTPCPHLHQGNDIFAPMGTPIVAMENGVLIRFDSEAVGGNSFYFAGDDGYSFYGAHLMSFAPGLHAGQRLAMGTLLGTVGNTGDAAGGAPHLHFQVYAPGKAWGTPEDPKFWLDGALNSAITHAGGVITDPSDDSGFSAPGQAPLDVGSLMSSVLRDGGHIISQPTVPVLLLVMLVLGVLFAAQTRTFKVAADRRRSRGRAIVPSFVGGARSTAITIAQPRQARKRRGAPVVDDAQDTPRPVWAAVPETAKPTRTTPSLMSRTRKSAGDKLQNLPGAMNKTLASRPARDTSSRTESLAGSSSTAVLDAKRPGPRASKAP